MSELEKPPLLINNELDYSLLEQNNEEQVKIMQRVLNQLINESDGEINRERADAFISNTRVFTTTKRFLNYAENTSGTFSWKSRIGYFFKLLGAKGYHELINEEVPCIIITSTQDEVFLHELDHVARMICDHTIIQEYRENNRALDTAKLAISNAAISALIPATTFAQTQEVATHDYFLITASAIAGSLAIIDFGKYWRSDSEIQARQTSQRIQY